MPDVSSQINELKGLPDQALQSELMNPSGAAPAYLILAEAQRRQLMRQSAVTQQNQAPVGSVYDDVIRSMMARQPPQGATPAGMTPAASAPPAAPQTPQNFKPMGPPQGMAEGGEVDDEGDDSGGDDDIVEMPLKPVGPFRPTKQQQPQRSAASYDDELEAAGKRYNVDPDLGRAVMRQESSGRPGVVSPKGAVGLMQLMPGTAADMGVTDPRDPHQNIQGGMRYLGELMNRYGGDRSKALAAYYAGMGAVDKWGGVPPAARDYVASVNNRYTRLQGINPLGIEDVEAPGAGPEEPRAPLQPFTSPDDWRAKQLAALQAPGTPGPGAAAPGPDLAALSGPSPGMVAPPAAAAKPVDSYDPKTLLQKRGDIAGIMGGGPTADQQSLRAEIQKMWAEAEARKKPNIWQYLTNFGLGMASTPSRNWAQSIAGGAAGMAKGVGEQQEEARKQELALMGVSSRLDDQMQTHQEAIGRATLDMAKTQQQAINQAKTHQDAETQRTMAALLHGRDVIDYKPAGVPVPDGYEAIPDQLNPAMQYIATPAMMKLENDSKLLPFLPGRKPGDLIPYAEYKSAQTMAAREAQAQGAFEKDFLPGYAESLGTTPNKLDPGQRQAGLVAFKTAQADPNIQTTAEEIAQGIIDGSQPPDMKGLYRYGAFVRASLARNHYDLTTAQRDWANLQRYYSTLNGANQMRLQQATEFVAETLPAVRQLYKDWQATGLPTGFKDYNKLALDAASRLPGPSGVAAQKLQTQLKDLTAEMGQMYRGGNASTDESLQLAAENLKGEWNPDTFMALLDQAENNVKIRRNSIRAVQPAGVSPNSRYFVQPGGAPATAAVPTAPTAPTTPIVPSSAPGAQPPVPNSIPQQYRSTAHYSPSKKAFYYSQDGGKTWVAVPAQ